MKILPWVLFLVMFFATGFTVKQLVDARREGEIAEQNHAATLDNTRAFFRRQVRSSTRLAIQARVEMGEVSDAMQEALDDRNADLVTIQRLEVQVDSLNRMGQESQVDTVIVERGDTVRVVTFEQEGPPIEGIQTVRIGPRVTLDSRLAVSPFSFTLGVACAGTAPVFTWDTPEWITALYEEGTVDPAVCYTEPGPALFEISTGKSIWLAVGLGIGYVVGGL